MKKLLALLSIIMILCLSTIPAMAEEKADAEASVAAEAESSADNAIGSKAMAAGICVGVAAFAGALAMGLAISKSNESIARQPEAEGSIKSNMMLGLVFIETVIIYALIVAILIIFVL